MNTDEKNQNALFICEFILISAICVSPMILF